MTAPSNTPYISGSLDSVQTIEVRPVWQKKAQTLVSGFAWHAVMIAVCAFVLVPIVIVFFGSFKTIPEFFSNPYGLPASWMLTNYRDAWNDANLQTAAVNSVISTVFGVGVSTLLAALAAYGISRFTFPGKLWLRLLFIGGLVVPVQLIILPLFIIFRQLGILGGLLPLCLVFAVFGIPLATLVLTGFFSLLPKDLEQAARIDGASHLEIFWRIVLPTFPSGAGRRNHPERRLDVERFLPRLHSDL